MRNILLASVAIAAMSTVARADSGSCGIPAGTVNAIQSQLAAVVTMNNGGLFSPSLMWSAIVDRQGRLCSVIKTGDAWPGSRSIAIAKASAANDFSNVKLALSTANLYAPTQPGGSLYGLNDSNPFNPEYQPQGTGLNQVPGGIITFGGGLALYKSGQVIGGLGVSGDTSCADHVIAFRMRHLAGFDKIPAGAGFKGTDNIAYPDDAGGSTFTQPHCLSTDIPPQNILK